MYILRGAGGEMINGGGEGLRRVENGQNGGEMEGGAGAGRYSVCAWP